MTTGAPSVTSQRATSLVTRAALRGRVVDEPARAPSGPVPSCWLRAIHSSGALMHATPRATARTTADRRLARHDAASTTTTATAPSTMPAYRR